MGSSDTFAVFDDKEFAEFLQKLKKNSVTLAQGSKNLAGAISANVFRDIMAHFDTEMGDDQTPWQQWSAIYGEHMYLLGKSGNKILQDTGRLRQSFLPGNYRIKDGGIVFYNPAKTESGFPYASAHDKGGKRLPQREFMWLSGIAMEEIAEVTLKILQEGEA